MKKLLALAVLLGYNAVASEAVIAALGATPTNLVSTANMGLTITVVNPGAADVTCRLYDSTHYPAGVLNADFIYLGATNYSVARYTNLVLTYTTNQHTYTDAATGNTVTNLVKSWSYVPTAVAINTNTHLPIVTSFTVPAASTVTKLVGVPFLRGTTALVSGAYTNAITYTYTGIN